MIKVIGILGVLVLAAAAWGWQDATSQPDKPGLLTTTTVELAEDQGIFLTLPPQVDKPISKSRAVQVAEENSLGGKAKNAILAQMRDQMGIREANGPVKFNGPVWVVEMDASTSGMNQALGQGGPWMQNPDLPRPSYIPGYVIVFVDARTGEFLNGVSMSHQ